MPLTLVPPPRYVLDERARRVANSLVIETDEPVENPFHERQQRLLTRPLYNSWIPPAAANHPGKRAFWAAANVGVFGDPDLPALVPDVFVSLDVRAPKRSERKTYFFWEYKKPPDVAVEIVSNREGNELGSKLDTYAAWGIEYYVVFDPDREISREELQVFALVGEAYRRIPDTYLRRLGLGVKLWTGVFEEVPDTYLRWCDSTGSVLLTGQESSVLQSERADRERVRADSEQRRADSEQRRADNEQRRADNEKARADLLSAKLRELGIDPDNPRNSPSRRA